MSYETAVQKELRIFAFYMGRLRKLTEQRGKIRFCVIEYLCRFPRINPYEMAACLSENYEIEFDDSSISLTENEKKRRKVYG